MSHTNQPSSETGRPGVGSLGSFFRPRSVAVIGASRERGSIGFRLLDVLIQGGFRGPIYPVNPRASLLAGKQAFASVLAVPGPIDLALIVVPRQAVLAVTDECAQKGVRNLVVISAGFAECGPEGRQLQEELLARVRRNGQRLIGPNCLGVYSNTGDAHLNATFVPVCPPAGGVAMSSDSGALGLALLVAASRLEVGISSFVSVGDRADVSSNDLLEYWEHDDDTSVILLYLESFGNPRRFARIARRVSRRKPIVAVKAGRTRAGQRAAGSHTAALAVSDVAVDALFHQTGVLRAETLEEMLDLAAALDHQPLPAGSRVGVLTNAGGPAILCADACEAGGLVLPELTPPARVRLASFLPAAASTSNPVDMIASAGPEQYRSCTEALLTSAEIDSLLVIHVQAGLSRSEVVAQAVAEGVAAARRSGITAPVLACWMPEGPRTIAIAPTESVPCYSFPEQAARVLVRLGQHARWKAQPVGVVRPPSRVDLAAAHKVCRTALLERGPGWLTAQETRSLLRALRFPVAEGGVAATPERAAALARAIGFPVAVKLASHRILHKTEMGGVHLNLADEQAVRDAFEAIRRALAQLGQTDAMTGVLVQPMIQGGTETLVGLTHDPVFGPLVAFGLGGVHVEVLRDVCFRVTPLTDQDAEEMLHSIRGSPLLEGYRGHTPADRDALKDLLLRVSYLAEELPEVRELDLNPVFALPPGQGCKIVDARIRVEGAGNSTEPAPNAEASRRGARD